MDKNLNTYSMRIKEWFGWHFPELTKICPDSETYCRIVNLIQNRENMSEDSVQEIEDIVHDGELA